MKAELRKFLLISSFILLPSHFAVAATYYISSSCTNNITVYNHTTDACTGGSDRSFSTGSNAVAYVSLAAGDTLSYCNNATYDENVKPTVSGNLGSPITVNVCATKTPVLRYTGSGVQAAAWQLEDVSYWTLSGLTFTGTGIYTSKYAVWVRANLQDITGNIVTGCTVTGWGGSVAQNTWASAAIAVHGRFTAAFHPISTTVSNNTITNCRTKGIEDSFKSVGTSITGNTITGMTEGRVASATSSVNEIGITTGSATVNTVISNNIIHDFQAYSSATMTAQGFATWVGIWPDAQATGVFISGNLVYNIGQAKVDTTNSLGSGWQAIGIFVESGINSTIIRENIVHDIGTEGIRNGSTSHTNSNNQYINNAVWKINQGTGGGAGTIGRGFVAYNGDTIRVENNAIFDASQAQIYFTSAAVSAGGHAINYNDYFDSAGGGKVGSWNSGAVTINTTWRTNCGCDANDKNANPLWVSSTDFHLQAGSTLIAAGKAGVDIGAYPTVQTVPPIVIAIVYPNGGQKFLTGDSVTVMWTANDTGDFVVEVTRDNGTTYQTIATTSNDTSYVWTVTAGTSNNCKIRVKSAGTPTQLDLSDAVFKISGYYVWLDRVLEFFAFLNPTLRELLYA